MEPGEIEFVADDGAPELPRAPLGPRVIRGLLVAAVLVAGLAIALSRPSGAHRPSAAPTSEASSSPASSSAVSISIGPPSVPSPSANVACMATAGCNVSTADLADIEAAVATHLPHATLSSVNTSVRTSGGIGLKQRIIEAHLDSVDVLVRIRPYLGPEPDPTVGITPTPPGLGSAFFRFTTASWVVDVQWTGTDATPPPADNLEALATDPRLEALG